MADFMDYQIQQQGAPRRRRQAQPMVQGQTPIMPNGQPMPQQGAPAQPAGPQQPQTQPAAAPATPQPPPGMEGWTSYGQGGWLPPGHPAAQQAPAPAQPAPAPAPQPAPDPQLGRQGRVDAQGVYTAGQAPTQTYQAQRINQFQAPDLAAVNNPLQQMIQGLLGNPQTMGPQVINQLKGRERDAAALMEKQTRDQMMNQLAARGISSDSPYAQGMLRNLEAGTNRGMLNSFRDIDINAIGQNRADMMNVAGLADSFQNSALNRAISAFQPQLQVAGERRAEQSNMIDSLMQRFGMQEGLLGNQAQTLQSAISGQRSADLQGRSLDLQGAISSADRAQRESEFGRSFGFEREKFNYGKEQEALAQQRAAGAQADANSRWADQQALAYQMEQEQQWNQLIGMLMQGGGF